MGSFGIAARSLTVQYCALLNALLAADGRALHVSPSQPRSPAQSTLPWHTLTLPS